jgi:hypothetical protein
MSFWKGLQEALSAAGDALVIKSKADSLAHELEGASKDRWVDIMHSALLQVYKDYPNASQAGIAQIFSNRISELQKNNTRMEGVGWHFAGANAAALLAFDRYSRDKNKFSS